MFFSKPILRFRVLGSRGNYPSFAVRSPLHVFVPSADLVWSAVVQQPLGDDWEKGEVGTFLPEEIRLFSAVCLSERDPFRNGALGLQLCRSVDVDLSEVPCALDDPAFDDFAASLVGQREEQWEREDLYRPCLRAPSYLSDAGSAEDAAELLAAIDPEDQLLLAGLGRLLSALQLRADAYLEEAFFISTISLGAAMEYVRLHLEERDGGKQSYAGVYDYFRSVFPFGDPFPEFLEWMYELRVIAVHPASRFGEHWSPGVMVGMVFELENWLKVIYRHLIVGDVPDLESA